MGPYMASPDKNKQTFQEEDQIIAYASSEMQGWRKTMEDAKICKLNYPQPRLYIFAVFDGHGGFLISSGSQVSKYCEINYIDILTKKQNFKKQTLKQAITQSFLQLDNSAFQGLKKGQNQNYALGGRFNSSGCTANVLIIWEDKICVANAGDSRSVLCRGGKAFPLSQDHKPDSQKQKKRIQNAGGIVSDGRVNHNLNLSRAIGDWDFKQNPGLKPQQQMVCAYPDVIEQKITQEDEFIIMGCDGIWQRFVDDNQKMVEKIQSLLNNNKNKLKTVLETLLDQLLAQNTHMQVGCDNMTSILINFKKK